MGLDCLYLWISFVYLDLHGDNILWYVYINRGNIRWYVDIHGDNTFHPIVMLSHLWNICCEEGYGIKYLLVILPKGRHQNKKHTSIRALPELPKPSPPTPQFGQLYRLYPADKNDVLRVWRKKILMMIIIVAMIILIKILVILMIMMTKNTEKPTNIVNFG